MKDKNTTHKRNRKIKNLTHKNKIKVYKNNNKQTNQKGGEKIGEGGFGCVVKPSIPCKLGQKSNNKYVSKIILNNKPYDYEKELEKLNYVKEIDKNNKYCISYIDECELDIDILKKRQIKDIIKVNYIDLKRDSTQFTLTDSNVSSYLSNNEKRQIKKDYCLIDPLQPYKYRNQIQVYGGENIKPILKNINNKYLKKYNYIKKNYKSICKHLIDGLKLMHKNEFVHRDIKLENMIYTKENNQHLFKYIDFGLSNILKYNKKLYLSGTPGFKPIDFAILFEMIVYYNKNYNLNDYNTRIHLFCYVIKHNSENINFIINLKNKDDIMILEDKNIKQVSINGLLLFKPIYSRNKINYLQYLQITIEELNKFYDLFLPYVLQGEKEYSKLLYNIYDGMVYKTDIFALGVVFGIMYYFLKLNDKQFKKLILQMNNNDSRYRININEVLESSFYKSIKQQQNKLKDNPKNKLKDKYNNKQ